MSKVIIKSVIGTIASAVIFLGLYERLGYERSELLAFSVLIGLSIASLQSK